MIEQIRPFQSSSTRADLPGWPNIPYRLAERSQCVPVELDVVLADVEASSVGVDQLEDWRVLTLNG